MTDHSDNFKAGGIPAFLMVTFFIAVVATRNELLAAMRSARTNGAGSLVMFVGTVLSAVMSMSLYFTAAWAYGLICTIVCFVFAVVATSPASVEAFWRPLLVIQSLWLAVLIGVPEPLGVGVISTVSNNCDSFYNSQRDKMCKSGWLAFNEIVAMLLISVVFLCQLTLVAKGVDAMRKTKSNEGLEPAPGHLGAPHYQNLQANLQNSP